MAEQLFSLIPAERTRDILMNLQAITGICVQLLDNQGALLMRFGPDAPCCARLKKHGGAQEDCPLHRPELPA